MRCTVGSRHLPCGLPIHRFVFEVLIAGGCILFLLTLLSPVPWISKSTPIALFVFEPYAPPAGWLPDNTCEKKRKNATNSQVVPSQELKYTGPGENRRTWIGFLGSCNMDDDKRIFCTKASIFYPQWNLTYVQANDVLNSSTLPKKIKTKYVFIDAVAIGIAVVFFIWLSIPYYFQPHIKFPGFPWNRRLNFLFSYIMLSCIVISIVTTAMSWSLYRKDLARFMHSNSFFEPAPCGTVRQLKPGVLMKVRSLKGGAYLWAGLGPCYFTMFVGWAYRVVYWDSPIPPSSTPDEETQAPGRISSSTSYTSGSEEKTIDVHSLANAELTIQPREGQAGRLSTTCSLKGEGDDFLKPIARATTI